MKKIFAILLTLFLCATATAQVENSIVIDTKSFRAVQQDALTGANVDPIGVDHSRRACARLKIFFHKMTREQLAELDAIFPSGTIEKTKIKVADYENVLILEMTAKPQVAFYLKHPTFGTSNEVTLSLEGNKEYQLEATLNQTYSIVVESNVVGADVYIDGVFKGQTGDNKKCTISDVMIGEHRLKVVYGSASGQRVIDVNKNAISFTQNVDIAASEPQYVVFAVEPKTAAVIIDGKQLTPDTGGVVTTVLQAGTYDYSVSVKMYHSQSGTFTVAGAKVQKSVTLAPAFGYLSVDGSMVNGATVFVDDENIGIAPVKSDKLASGEHSVRIVKDKYKPYSTTVTVRDSETTTLAPTLSADFATVTLTTASGATIWVNGVEKGSGSWSGELSTGTYIFEARQSGHRSAQISKTIAATPSRQSYAIPAPTPIMGSVDITSSPAMADITLDGKAVGTTPVKLNNILVGEHKITVSKSGYQPYTTTVTVAEGNTATVNATLTKQVTQTPRSALQTVSNRKTYAPYRVGDYYNDGVKEGVVFEVSVDGRSGKIVSMKQADLQWSSDSAEQKRLIGAISKTDGAANMAKVKARPDWQSKYPAFKWCADLGEGWYLPSIEELKVFTLNTAVHDAVNRTLIARGGIKLYSRGEWEWYWSSTELDKQYGGNFCAWNVGMYNGDTRYSSKSGNFYVRAVSAFGDSSKTLSAVTTVSNSKTTAPYKVGDYYDENGKQGVVFEVSADGSHGKIVSMKQSAEILQWSSDSAEQKRLIGADSKTDGAANMAKVKARRYWQSKYPAFKWCADLGEGWYLPSIEELKTLTLNDAVHDAVNRTLIARGGTKLYDKGEISCWYWSSTEDDYQWSSGEFCAWRVSMYYGNTAYYDKHNDYYVRAVSAF